MPMDEWLPQFVQALGQLPDTSPNMFSTSFVASVVGHLVPLAGPPALTANLLALSGITQGVMGKCLALQAAVKALEVVSGVPCAGRLVADGSSGLRADLFEALQHPNLRSPTAPVEGRGVSEQTQKQRNRASASIQFLLADKTAHVLFALAHQVALSHSPNTIVDAKRLLCDICAACSSSDSDAPDIPEELIVKRHHLMKHICVASGWPPCTA